MLLEGWRERAIEGQAPLVEGWEPFKGLHVPRSAIFTTLTIAGFRSLRWISRCQGEIEMPEVECFEAIDNALKLLGSDVGARRRLEWCGLVLGKSCREWHDLDLKREFGDLDHSSQQFATVASAMFEIANGRWNGTAQMVALRHCAEGIVDRIDRRAVTTM